MFDIKILDVAPRRIAALEHKGDYSKVGVLMHSQVLKHSSMRWQQMNQVVEIIYKKGVSKGCLPRIVDVHQVAIGNNGKLYMHG